MSKLYSSIQSYLLIALLFAVHTAVSQTNTNGIAPVKIEKAGPAVSNLAPTPPMGWNSWNTFQTNINETLLKEMVDAYVSSGMKDAGYHYFVLDDGWMS